METTQKKFSCTFCDKVCSSLVKLKNHIHFRHESVHTCEKCGKTFLQKSKLKRHYKVHTKQKKPIFHCPICDFSSSERKEMLEHYYNSHNYDMSTETHTFMCSDEFNSWLNEITKMSQEKFVNTGIAWVLKDGSKCTLYKCHRDGFFFSRGKNIRRHLNSNKINGFCPAGIKVITNAQGEIEVKYLKTHVGHSKGDGRISLKCRKENIMDKLNRQVRIDFIFNSIKESILPPDAKAIFLSRNKIFNIASNYGLNDENVVKSDFPNFNVWIEHLMVHSMVHFYKPVGSVCIEYPSIKAEDFLLVIMNETQKILIDEFSSNCICIDKIQGMKKCDYQLISLSVVDNMNQGLPCAFFLTNREDDTALEIFFIVIRNIMNKKVAPNVFISDEDEIYYNTWSKVMGTVNFRLYSPWNVDRLWRNNILKIERKESQVEVYEKVIPLIFETSISTFKNSISSVMNELNSKEKQIQDFISFFQKYYSDPFPWARSHWLQAGLNSNMQSLENIHFIIKTFYAKRKKVQIDKVVTLLLKYVRDKLFEQMILWKDEILLNKMLDLEKSHSAANNLSCAIIEEENGKWFVTSVDDENGYVIHSLKSTCVCSLQCKECYCCIHKYDCSCEESSIYWKMCKHIHFLNLGLRKLSSQVEELPSNCQPDSPIMTAESSNPTDSNLIMFEPTFKQNQKLSCQKEESLHSDSNKDVCWSAKQEELCTEFRNLVKHIHSEESYKAAKKMFASLRDIIHSVQP